MFAVIVKLALMRPETGSHCEFFPRAICLSYEKSHVSGIGT